MLLQKFQWERTFVYDRHGTTFRGSRQTCGRG
jgi:hypothetical protein